MLGGNGRPAQREIRKLIRISATRVTERRNEQGKILSVAYPVLVGIFLIQEGFLDTFLDLLLAWGASDSDSAVRFFDVPAPASLLPEMEACAHEIGVGSKKVKEVAVIIVLIIRGLDNRSVIRVLTLGLDSRDRDVVVIVWIIFTRRRGAAIFSPDPGSEVAILKDLALEQLRTREASPNQMRGDS